MDKIFNLLSADDIKQIKETEETVIKIRTKKALCTHRDESGMTDSLIFDRKGCNATCKICGASFSPLSTNEDIKPSIEKVINAINSMKIVYPDMDKETAKRIYSILPMLEDLDSIYRNAIGTFNQRVNNFERKIMSSGMGMTKAPLWDDSDPTKAIEFGIYNNYTKDEKETP